MEIEAYFEEWSRLPGEKVRMAISTDASEVRARLERIVRGPGVAPSKLANHEFGVDTDAVNLTVPGRRQSTAIGSYAEFPLGDLGAGLVCAHAWFQPSVPEWEDAQTLLAMCAENGESLVSVSVKAERLYIDVSGMEHRTDVRLKAGIWYSILVDGSDPAAIGLDVRQVSGLLAADPSQTAEVPTAGLDLGAVRILRLGARSSDATGSAVDGYNGKIDSPRVFVGALTADQKEALHQDGTGQPAANRGWALTTDFNAVEIPEVEGRAEPGRIVNGAERGVTGRNWTGEVESYVQAPDQYGAIYFHSDDMVESGWEYDLEFDLPDDLPSGLYAVRLDAGGAVDRYPLFVRGAEGSTADVLFVAPTATYLAYANDRFAGADLSGIMGHERGEVSTDELYMNESPHFGLSCYDVHADGSPVRYSSRRRPLVNVRPNYPSWLTGSYRHFTVDLFFIEWLERSGRDYHVVTDEDVHREGLDLFKRYKVAVTGSHPEYWSSQGLDALQEYVSTGGRLMYMGGNGFYWVTTYDPDRPWVIEVRRDQAGLRAWDAPNGERAHVHSAEIGGLWRYRGRGPNTIAGVAFTTEGFSQGQGYRRTPESYDPGLSPFFDGIEDEMIGDFGYILGGAAGDECDRFDLILGSPPQTVVLASATGFGREYLIVNELVHIPMPDQDGSTRPDMVRADMVYLPVHGKGAVFSTSSIAFAGAMAWNGFENNAAKLVDNVLDTFITHETPPSLRE